MTRDELDKLTTDKKREMVLDIYADLVADMKEHELDEFLLDN